MSDDEHFPPPPVPSAAGAAPPPNDPWGRSVAGQQEWSPSHTPGGVVAVSSLAPGSLPAGPQPVAGRGRWGVVGALLVVVALIVGAGSTAVTYALVHRGQSSAAGSSGLAFSSQTPPAAKLNGTITAAVSAISASVVTVNVSAASGQSAGTGSGIVIRRDGYILTNNHVVTLDSQTAGTSNHISVTLADGSTKPATVVGTDQTDDLAVVKVQAAGLNAATFAASSKLTVGQSVVAIGAPLGLSNTVTSGIVSSLARPVTTGSGNSASIFDAIQTDAAINPGNSGGPLVDLNGHVVGVNSAIAGTGSTGGTGPQSGNIGIGFAIPSDEAGRIANQLIGTGKATHPILGITVAATPAPTGPTSATGATVRSVQPGSPAQKAGLHQGDVITQIGQQRIDDSVGAIAATRSYAPGATVKVTVRSGGQNKTVTITLARSTAN